MIPPQAPEIEESIIGTMLLDPMSQNICFDKLLEDDFYVPLHKEIFKGMCLLQQEGKPIDALTVEEKIGKEVFTFTTYSSYESKMEAYCDIIKNKATLRKLITGCNDIIQKAYAGDEPDVLDQAQAMIFNVDSTKEDYLHDINDTLMGVIDQISQIQENGKPLGVSTGLDLDHVLGGFQNGKMYVIGARPSMGKTALVMTMLRNMAQEGVGAGIISLETTAEDLGIRLLSSASKIPAETITSGRMSQDQMAKILDTCSLLSSHNIYIDDSPAMTTQQLRSKCRVLTTKGCKVIFIDFLTLISEEGRSKHEEVGVITKTIQQLAKELNVPIIALAQLSRSIESRPNKMPLLSDLRESGSIEENAHGVLFLYRDEYYGIDTDEHGSLTKGLADIIIAKNKNGKTGAIKHTYDAPTMTFGCIK